MVINETDFDHAVRILPKELAGKGFLPEGSGCPNRISECLAAHAEPCIDRADAVGQRLLAWAGRSQEKDGKDNQEDQKKRKYPARSPARIRLPRKFHFRSHM
jgi:hypothetical protein